MADMMQVHEFALKWLEKFQDPNINYLELIDGDMGEKCRALDFEMDFGHAFEEKYSDAVYNSEALSRIIDRVDDIPLLGSAIYSRWRYFNHWAYSGAEILEPENREWFILALTRLAELADGKPQVSEEEICSAAVQAAKVERNPEMYRERQKLLKTINRLDVRASVTLELIEPMKTMSEEEKEAFAKSLRLRLERGEIDF